MANALTWGETPTDDDKLWGMLGHLVAFVFPLGGPLVVWLIYRDKAIFVRYHALQSLIFQVIIAVIGSVTCGIGFLLLALQLWLAWRAYQGEWAGYPLIDGIGRN